MEVFTRVKALFNKKILFENLREGLRVGLFAFIISYLISLVLALIIGFLFLENVNEIILGDIGSIDKLNFVTLLRMTALLMNFSVFNSIGTIKVGVFLFSVIPFISFFISNKKDNRRVGVTYTNILIYLAASIVFAFLLLIISFIMRGELIGIQINFFYVNNFIGALGVTLLIQLIIGIYYNKNARPAIKSVRFLLKVLMGTSAIIGTIELIRFMIGYSVNILIKIGAYLVLIPNITVYNMLSFMGVKIKISDSIIKVVEFLGIDFESTFNLSPITRYSMLIIFFGIIMYCILSMKRKNVFRETFFLSIIVSVISTFLAYTTIINLGTVFIVEDISLGGNIIWAFFLPLIIINAIGLVIYLIKKLVNIAKEG